jgi:LPXTG-site transpeptidase (sortase) family protein
MRRWLSTLGLYALGLVFVVAGLFGIAQATVLSDMGATPTERAIKPTVSNRTLPKPVEAKDTEKKQELEQIEKAIKEPDVIPASASASATSVAPADTTMYLSVPKMGIYDIPVVEGTTEASLSVGAGHYSGSGYPWVAGSNTYIAGHRVGYPGTASDHVFYNLPNLVPGDQVIITDSNGTTYNYAVSEILEVPITDLSVTAPVGGDVVSLQTCIENYGDYWTMGPNWNVRYVVRATPV